MSRMKYRLRIESDPDMSDPSKEDCHWRIYGFLKQFNSYTDPATFFHDSGKPRLAIANKLRHGLAFMLDYYEHGLGMWSVSGSRQTEHWDTSRCSGIAVWEDSVDDLGAKTPDERARDVAMELEEYTNWCNGDCHWYELKHANGKEIYANSAIGSEWAAEDIRNAMPADANKDNTIVEGDGAWIGDYHSFFKEVELVA